MALQYFLNAHQQALTSEILIHEVVFVCLSLYFCFWWCLMILILDWRHRPHRGSHLALSLSTFPMWDLTSQTIFSNNFNPDAEGSKTSLQCCWSFIYLVCRNRIWSWVIIKAVPKARCTYKRIKRCQSAKLKAPGITFKWPDDRRPLLTDYIL